MATDIYAALPRFVDYYHTYTHNRLLPKSPWESMFPRAEWDWSKGATQSIYTYEPNVSGAMTDIAALTVAAGSGSGVGTATFTPDITVEGGNTARTTQLERFITDTAYINVDDLHRDFFGAAKHIENLLTNLAIENADWSANWRRNRSFQYIDSVRAANASGVLESVASATVTGQATLQALMDTLTEANVTTISDSHLKKLWIELTYNDADRYGTLNGLPAYAIIGSHETISHLFKEDITEELKYADPQSNLSRLGVTRGANGFIPIYDPKAYRFSHSTGFAWVPPTVTAATTNGSKTTVNPAWMNAEFELIWLMGANFATIETEPVAPLEFGSATFGSPLDHMGSPKWISGQDPTTDPFGKTGRYVSEFRVAFRPERPQAMIPILVKVR